MTRLLKSSEKLLMQRFKLVKLARLELANETLHNKFLQTDKNILSCLLLTQKPRHHVFAAEEKRYNCIREKYSGQIFVDIFSVPNLDNQDYKDIILYLVDDPIISNSHFVKRIVSFHFGGIGIWQIIYEAIDLFGDAYSISFRDLPKRFRRRIFELNSVKIQVPFSILPKESDRQVHFWL